MTDKNSKRGNKGTYTAPDATPRAQREDHFQTLVAGIPHLVWRAAGVGHWTWSSPQWSSYTGMSMAESQAQGWLKALHPNDRTESLAAWEKAATDSTFQTDHRIFNAGERRYRWCRTRAIPAGHVGRGGVEWIGTSTDVDDLYRLRDRERSLLVKLQHTVRNSMSVIRSVTRRTAETSKSMDDLAMHLDGRIGAFARVQAAVTRCPENGIDLALLISDELLAAAGPDCSHFTVEGPEVRLQPPAAGILGLVVHELATNAIKFGALQPSGGLIRVTWHATSHPAGQRLVLEWKEQGVAGLPDRPKWTGFGADLLYRNLPYQLQAEVSLACEPNGVRWVIEIPTSDAICIDANL